MSTVSSLGIGSGLDANSIISQLMALNQQPITNLQTKNSDLSSKVSEWGKVQSVFSTLSDASSTLASSTFWSSTTSASTDDKSVSVTTGTGASAGSYSVNVKSLAQSQYITSSAFASSTSTVGTGTLTIQRGTFDSTPVPPTFAATSGISSIGITIGPGDNTLEKIRDKINAANAGVTATVISDTAGARLVLRGPSGKDQGFTVTATDDDGNNTDGAGLSALAFDPSNGVTNMAQNQMAGDAVATINGISVSSSTNTFANVVDGLTIKVGQVTPANAPVSLTVSQDTAGITKGINTFVSAYNSLVSLIRTDTAYDATSKTAGPLQADATATGLLSQIRSLASGSTTASSKYGRLPDIGLNIGLDGTITVDNTKLTTALGSPDELKKFFSNIGDTTAGDGLGVRFKKLASAVTGSDGAITARTSGLRATIKRNTDQIQTMTERNTATEAALRKQYTALDQSMAKLNGLSSYMTNQLAALNKTTSSG